MEKRIDGPTPCGGAYAIIYYFNDNDESVSPVEATKGIGCEYDENGHLLKETWLIFNRNKEQNNELTK